jgi:hypothetical protein
MHVRCYCGQRLGPDGGGAGSRSVAGDDVACGVADHPRLGEGKIEVVGGLVEHPGGGLAARAGDAEVWHCAVRVVRADVDSVELNAVAGEEPSEPLVHQVQGSLVEQPARQSALVGDGHQGETRVVEGAQRRADSWLEDQVVGVRWVMAGLRDGAVAVE